MKTLACIALSLVACSKKPSGDVCQQIADKAWPVVQEMAKAAGKDMPPGAADEMTQQCRDRLKSGKPLDADSKCMLAAADQAAVRECFEVGVRDYQRKSKAIEGKVMLHAASRDAKRAFLDKNGYVVGKAGPTPTTPCCAQPNHVCADNPGEWAQSPIWTALEIAGPESNQYQLTYESTDGKSFVMTAIGDPDCDGHPMTLTVHGSVDANGAPVADDPK